MAARRAGALVGRALERYYSADVGFASIMLGATIGMGMGMHDAATEAPTAWRAAEMSVGNMLSGASMGMATGIVVWVGAPVGVAGATVAAPLALATAGLHLALRDPVASRE